MSRGKQNRSRQNSPESQLTLNFFVEVKPAAPSPTFSRDSEPLNSIDGQLRSAINAALDGLDRDVIAQRMTARLGREVRRDQLDQWCAPSQTGRRPHADALVALMFEAKQVQPLRQIAGLLGFRIMTDDEVLLAEFGAAVSVEQEMIAKRKAISAQMNQRGLGRAMVNRLSDQRGITRHG